MTKRISRRDVLKTAAAAAPLIVSASALGYEGPSAARGSKCC